MPMTTPAEISKHPGLAKGPRLPKADPRKLKRKRAKAARKRNRGAYSGQ